MNEVTFRNVYQTTQNPSQIKLGQRASTPDGREWVYVYAGAALSNGHVAVPAAATVVTTPVTSSTDGLGRIVYITKANAGWVTGQFQDAIGVINTGTGAGQTFKVKTNTSDTIELYPESALLTALSASDSGFILRTMNNVVKAAVTSKTQGAVGVAQTAFAQGDYGWLLTNGDGGVVAGNTLVVGSSFTTGAATAGEVVVGTTGGGSFDQQSLGFALSANTAADQIALVRVIIR